ncbi:unnamed protein product [Phyllotreta striolata]|uniref:Uncharacterized protein n=1 Tax=Phyllotreta striolata TaxID=444603 RepID=A0A9N9TIC2_PHYSR|nr:unnamed protein product [Phyllotreta striolata]
MDPIEPPTAESVDELRLRLKSMRRLMKDRNGSGDFDSGRRPGSAGVIDGNFLSVTFSAALVIIITVSIYAFYNLYVAVMKKFTHVHDEL